MDEVEEAADMGICMATAAGSSDSRRFRELVGDSGMGGGGANGAYGFAWW